MTEGKQFAGKCLWCCTDHDSRMPCNQSNLIAFLEGQTDRNDDLESENDTLRAALQSAEARVRELEKELGKYATLTEARRVIVAKDSEIKRLEGLLERADELLKAESAGCNPGCSCRICKYVVAKAPKGENQDG